MNDYEQVEIFERDLLMESLLTAKILSTNDLNYHVTDVGMGNYFLYENLQSIHLKRNMKYEKYSLIWPNANMVAMLVLFLSHLRDI